MSLALRFNQLRNNIWSTCSVSLLKQYAGLSSGKLLDPRSYEKRQFTTRVQTLETTLLETANLHTTGLSPCVPGIQPLKPERTPIHGQPATVLIFDIETTGFLHPSNRIIEFALCDLSGGKNSTFETLINPDRDIPGHATAVHHIHTHVVRRPDIPRFSEILPLLLAFVQTRQTPGKPVLWVAHKGNTFDAPFLAHEFGLCKRQIPADWLFVDSLCLARKLVKLEAKKGEKRKPVNLHALSERYGISWEGPEHRAMQDAKILSQVFQKITFDLKLSYEGLMNEAIKASDLPRYSDAPSFLGKDSRSSLYKVDVLARLHPNTVLMAFPGCSTVRPSLDISICNGRSATARLLASLPCSSAPTEMVPVLQNAAIDLRGGSVATDIPGGVLPGMCMCACEILVTSCAKVSSPAHAAPLDLRPDEMRSRARGAACALLTCGGEIKSERLRAAAAARIYAVGSHARTPPTTLSVFALVTAPDRLLRHRHGVIRAGQFLLTGALITGRTKIDYIARNGMDGEG